MKSRHVIRQVHNNLTGKMGLTYFGRFFLKVFLHLYIWLGVICFIFINNAYADDSCSVVKIMTFKQVGSITYYQEGVGWIYDWQISDVAKAVSKNEKSPAPKRSGKADAPQIPKKLRIVTPAHVIFEGTKIFAECNNISFELRPLGISSTLDLAVLQSAEASSLPPSFKPLFEISPNLTPVSFDESILKDNTSLFPLVVHFKGSTITKTNLGVLNEKLTPQFNYQFPQYKKSIMNSAGGIRPGMSGSPLFYEKSKPPVGMNLKTKINDHISLVLPTEELISFIPELEKGQDPWKIKHPLYEIEFVHYFDSNKHSLQRYRQLTLKNNQGMVTQKYMEPCQFGSMVETSTWQEAAGDGDYNLEAYKSSVGNPIGMRSLERLQEARSKLKLNHPGGWLQEINKDKNKDQFQLQEIEEDPTNRPSVDRNEGQSRGGGSWGDSGGGQSKAKTHSYYTGDLPLDQGVFNANNVLQRLMYLGSHQYFLSKNICEREGLIEYNLASSEKKRLLGRIFNFKGEMNTVKTDDVEALLLAILVNEKDPTLAQQNIYAEDKAASLKLICNKSILGNNLKVYGNKVDHGELTNFIPQRPWNDFDVRQFFDHKSQANNHMLLMKEKKYLSKSGENDVVYMECLDDGDTIKIVSKNNDWSYDLEIEDGELSGSFSISDIETTYELNPLPLQGTKGLWSYIAINRENGAKVQVTLDPFNDPLVSIRFIEIPEIEKRKHSHGYQNTNPPIEYMESLWYIQN